MKNKNKSNKKQYNNLSKEEEENEIKEKNEEYYDNDPIDKYIKEKIDSIQQDDINNNIKKIDNNGNIDNSDGYSENSNESSINSGLNNININSINNSNQSIGSSGYGIVLPQNCYSLNSSNNSSINIQNSLSTNSSGINSGTNESTPIINGSLQVDGEQLMNVGHKKQLPLFRLICLTISFLGVQFGWALQIAFSTPLFLELGVSQNVVSYIWLAGPISGLIVQPLVGVLTDRSESKFGRRKPFILIGSIFISVGLILISNAESIGTWVGDSEGQKSFAIAVAIIGFWILDLSNNAVQAPCRALLVDVAAPSQQSLGSSLFSLMLGIGNLLGYMMGSINLVKVVPFMKTDTRALFTLSILVLLICVTMTLVFVVEERYVRVNDDKSSENPLKQMLKGFINMPSYMKRLCSVQFFSWIGWFSFILFVTTWVGVNVYGGNPNAPEGSPERTKFQEGVRWGSLGLTISSGVTIGISLLIPILIRFVGIKKIYIFGNILQCIFFALFLAIHDKIGSILLIAATGIPWAVVMILPFSIVGMGVQDNESSGLHIGTLNIFIVVPQMLVSLGISFIIDLFKGNVVYSLVTGSIASLVASALCLRLIIPSHGHAQNDIEEIQFSFNNNQNINIDNNGKKYSPMIKSSDSIVHQT
ncbi:hypothetical protein DICPUDRAFT_97918 [Dictyostelium purpureum]|uniref:Major facilitator superfamily (MFS) profile domain-containing protein n=1 Tax=Dictyostelium purpureum TaxID=5786 RepID=F0ZL05_DICPU|nr:uncharacterized protein DICPUDRAFT_97918 [Dictyostelium purpureum]EGC35355.1 hypothetical protein DICPUDRAFT_97918 [Dictyostelium purpureum]|eukprot:XP_003288093.1 hypothetical protein DICPUDRAFT_97918 [Dictyostelium purpureum]